MKGEIATSTIIWITIGLVVLIVMVIGVPNILKNGFNFFGEQECRATVDSDGDGLYDAADPCPCDNIGPQYVGKECRTCTEYTQQKC